MMIWDVSKKAGKFVKVRHKENALESRDCKYVGEQAQIHVHIPADN